MYGTERVSGESKGMELVAHRVCGFGEVGIGVWYPPRPGEPYSSSLSDGFALGD